TPGAEGVPTTSATPSERHGDDCDAVLRWATDTSFDTSQAAVRDFYRLREQPDAFSAAKTREVRKIYFEYQEQAVRLVAGTTANAELKSALQDFADGWAELAARSTSDGPDSPDGSAVGKVCPLTVKAEATPVGTSCCGT
ncbi:MAG: hypothetical protein ABW156_06095, partial [Jiangellaceae bacterium]